jgi:hypothetical protein
MSIRDPPEIPSPGEREKRGGGGEGREGGERGVCIYIGIKKNLPFINSL